MSNNICHGPTGPRVVSHPLIPICKTTRDKKWIYRCSYNCINACDGINGCQGEIFPNAGVTDLSSGASFGFVIPPFSIPTPMPTSAVPPGSLASPVASGAVVDVPTGVIVTSVVGSTPAPAALPVSSESTIITQDPDDQLLTEQVIQGNFWFIKVHSILVSSRICSVASFE